MIIDCYLVVANIPLVPSQTRISSPDSGEISIGPPASSTWRIALARLEGAYSEHTLRGYRADFGCFETWCHENALTALPASPETVAAFVAADAVRSSVATLKRRICAVRKIHRLMRLPNPGEDEEVLTAMRRAMRSKRRRPQQALGLTAALRDQLIAATPSTLHGLRDRALIAVGYDTLCRRSELVNLRVEDLTPLASGGGKVLVRRAKNDPFGDGRRAHISGRGYQYLMAWLVQGGIDQGFIFRVIVRERVFDRELHPVVVGRVLKAAARRARLDEQVVAGLSGHSMRVGAAQDLMVAGKQLPQIMTAGGWTSVNVVGRYVREADFSVWSE